MTIVRNNDIEIRIDELKITLTHIGVNRWELNKVSSFPIPEEISFCSDRVGIRVTGKLRNRIHCRIDNLFFII